MWRSNYATDAAVSLHNDMFWLIDRLPAIGRNTAMGGQLTRNALYGKNALFIMSVFVLFFFQAKHREERKCVCVLQ